MASPFTPPTLPGAAGYPLGLTGATAATRYVGATASGAPGSGTFAVGDFVIDQTGKVYVCTVAGSPGTWVAIGASTGPTQLVYTEITADVTIASTSSAAPTTLITAGSAVTLDGTTRICIEVHTPLIFAANAGAELRVNLWESTTDLGRIMDYYAQAGTGGTTLYGVRYFTPASGTYTYVAKGYKSGGASASTFGAGVGGAATPYPAFLRISTAPS